MSKARYNSYIICTSPRSGSTLLCKMLAATGISGNPDSHFHKPSLDSWLKTYNFSPTDFETKRDALIAIFEAAINRGSGDTDIFGLRLQRGSFDFFMQQTGNLYQGLPTDKERLQAAFGKTLFIYLTRKNKLDQAISLVMANQTGLWHKAADGTELERSAAPQKPIYDAKRIAAQIAELDAFENAWKNWFLREKISPMDITYDALSADPNAVLADILDILGLGNSSAKNIVVPVAKLGDETNHLWAERFMSENIDR